MELLNPSCPPLSPEFSSPTTFRRGFGRTGSSSLPEIVEEDGNNNNNKIHVALGKSVEKAMSLLDWTFRRFHGKDVCILHVHQPSHLIPTYCKSVSPNGYFEFSDNLPDFLVFFFFFIAFLDKLHKWASELLLKFCPLQVTTAYCEPNSPFFFFFAPFGG